MLSITFLKWAHYIKRGETYAKKATRENRGQISLLIKRNGLIFFVRSSESRLGGTRWLGNALIALKGSARWQ
jgi:hypothetical protein